MLKARFYTEAYAKYLCYVVYACFRARFQPFDRGVEQRAHVYVNGVLGCRLGGHVARDGFVKFVQFV